MSGEIVGSASIRIEPDISGFEAALTSDLQASLDRANEAIVQSFKDAAQQATDSLSAVGTDGFDSVATAANSTAGDVTTAFTTAADATAAGFVAAGADLSASVASGAAEAAGSLDALGASVPNLTIPVDADVSAVDAAIQGAVTTADAEVATIQVDADTSSADQAIADLGTTASDTTVNLEGLSGGIEHVAGSSESAAGLAAGLGASIGKISPEAAGAVAGIAALAEVTKGFFTDALNADAATRFLTKTTGEFKDQVESVNIGGLNGNLQDLAKQVGTNVPLLETAAGKIFQLGTSSGVAGPQVADTADKVVALAINARNLRPALGEAGDIVDSLGKGLARGGRFLAAYGISLTGAAINQEAFKETGKATAAQLTQYDKEAAGATLATEKLAGSFKTNLADALDNPAIKIAILKNNFELLKEKLGEPLIDPVIQALQAFEPLAEAAAVIIGDVVVALTPLLTVAGAVVGPIAALGTAAGTLGPTLIGLATAAGIATLALNTLELTPVGVLIGVAAAAVVAVGALIHAFDSGPSAAEQFKAGVEKATAALTDQTGQITVNVKTVEDYIKQTNGFDGGKFATGVKNIGVSTRTLTNDLLGGEAGAKRFNAAVDAAGSGKTVSNIAGLNDVTKKTKEEFAALQKELDATAAAAIRKAAADHLITETEKTVSLEASNHVKELQRLQPELKANAAAVENLTAKYGPEIDAVTAGSKSLEALGASSTLAHDAIVTLTTSGVQPSQASFLTFATSIKDAHLTTKEMDLAAGSLGITTDALKGFVDGATKALDGFVQKVLSGLPQIADAFKGANNVIDFTKNLKKQTKDTEDFLIELDQIMRAGGTQLAGTLAQQGLAAGGSYAHELSVQIVAGHTSLVKGAEAAVDAANAELNRAQIYLTNTFGPAYIAGSGLIASLAADAFKGNLNFEQTTALAAGLAKDASLGADAQSIAVIWGEHGQKAAENYASLMHISDTTRDQGIAAAKEILNNDLIGNAGQLGTDTTNALDKNVNPGIPDAIGGALAAAGAVITNSGPIVTTPAAQIASDSLFAISNVLVPGVPQAITEALTAGKTAIDDQRGIFGAAGGALGDATSSGIGPGIAANAGLIPTALRGLIGDSNLPLDFAKSQGHQLGVNLAQGLIAGIQAMNPSVRSVSALMVQAAADAAKAAAKPGSPSRLFAEIGVNLGEGLAKGMDDTQTLTNTAAANAVLGANDAARTAADAHSPSKLFAQLGADILAGLALGMTDTNSPALRAAENAINLVFARTQDAINAATKTENASFDGGKTNLGAVHQALIDKLQSGGLVTAADIAEAVNEAALKVDSAPQLVSALRALQVAQTSATSTQDQLEATIADLNANLNAGHPLFQITDPKVLGFDPASVTEVLSKFGSLVSFLTAQGGFVGSSAGRTGKLVSTPGDLTLDSQGNWVLGKTTKHLTEPRQVMQVHFTITGNNFSGDPEADGTKIGQAAAREFAKSQLVTAERANGNG